MTILLIVIRMQFVYLKSKLILIRSNMKMSKFRHSILLEKDVLKMVKNSKLYQEAELEKISQLSSLYNNPEEKLL